MGLSKEQEQEQKQQMWEEVEAIGVVDDLKILIERLWKTINRFEKKLLTVYENNNELRQELKNKSRKIKIYISGPITGDPNAKAKFDKAQKKLAAPALEIINPFEIAEREGLDARGATWEEYMSADIRELVTADFIYMLPGWKQSRGARIERKLAKILKIGVIYEQEAGDD
jgi:hypothetical protein